MQQQQILSEVLVRNNKLLLTLKDAGTVYFPWRHDFPTKILSAQERDQLKKEFANYSPREFDRIPQFNILQITAGVDFPQQLRRAAKTNETEDLFGDDKPSKTKRIHQLLASTDPAKKRYGLFAKHFVTGHYIQTARWKYSVPWRHAEVDSQVLALLQEKKQREKTLQHAITTAVAQLQSSTKAAQRRIKNFDEYVATHWDKLATILDDNSAVQALQQQVAAEQKQLEQRVQELFGNGTVRGCPIIR